VCACQNASGETLSTHGKFEPRLLSGAHGEEAPLARNSFQLVHPALLKIDSGTRHEVLHGPGDKHTARLGFRHDARTRVDRDAADVVAHQFAFAGMHSRAHFNTELPDRQRNGERAAHRSCRAVERREKTVAGGVGFLPPKASQFLSHNRVVRVQEITPGLVAKRRCALEDAMSRKSTVARIRSEESIGRSPVMNSWMSDSTVSMSSSIIE